MDSNNIGFMIFAILVLFSIVYMWYMNKKRKESEQNIDINLERTKATENQKKLLREDFSFVQKWMKNEPIDAFTSCTIPVTVADIAKNTAIDLAKTGAWALVGVKARYHRVETQCFLVLSGMAVHYFITDVEGDLEQQIVFDAFRLKSATIVYKGVKTNALTGKQAQAYLPIINDLNFHIDGEVLTIEVHDRLKTDAGVSTMLTGQYYRSRVVNQVVGELFLKKLIEKFPNLANSTN
jgi:hypothetical protein